MKLTFCNTENAEENADAMKKSNEPDDEKTMKKAVLQKVFKMKNIEESKNYSTPLRVTSLIIKL